MFLGKFWKGISGCSEPRAGYCCTFNMFHGFSTNRYALVAILLVLTIACSLAAPPAMAEEPPAPESEQILRAAADRSVDEALTRLEDEAAGIRELLEYLNAAPEWDRDALHFRIDQRLKALLDQLNGFAIELWSTDVALEAREEFRDRVIVLVNWTLARCLARLEQINVRIAEARSDFEEFDTSLQGAIAQSFIQEQVRLRFDYARAIVDHLNARDRLALDPVLADRLETASTALRGEVERRIQRLAEQLVGQIRLDSATLSELRNRRAEDPLNQDLERAYNALRKRHSRSLNNLDSTIAMLSQLEVGAAEYRTLLLQQRGFIGIELLQREVFFTVMRDQIHRFQKGLVRGSPNFIFRMAIFLAVVGIALLLARWGQRTVRYLVSREFVKLGQLASDVLVSISWFVTFLAGLIIALYTLGISVTPLLAGFGVAGIIIGLALQDALSNLASGAAILLYRPYDVDDHIKIAGGEGKVKKMNLVATTIHTFDNQALVIPNNKIWGDTIINFTANRVRRVDIEATFGYSEDLDRVEKVLRDILDNYEPVLKRPEPLIHMGRLGDSSVSMMVKPWVRTEDYWTAQRFITREIKRRFDQEGISIPFPQRDVHIYYEQGNTPTGGARNDQKLNIDTSGGTTNT